MKKTLLILVLVASGNLYAQTNQTPEAFMRYYIRVVNEENPAKVQKCYHFPYAVIENGQLTCNENETAPVID